MLAGADALGLNFYKESPRYLESEVGQKIVSVLKPSVKRIGLFVNSTAAEINQVIEQFALDYIQLHGDEPAEFLSDLAERPIIRAFRFDERGGDHISSFLGACGSGRRPDAILIDASKPGEYGGTGEVVDWGAVSAARPALEGIPLVLAGGLTPFNVAAAIAKVRPEAVDTASGVESAPANKDPMLVRAFVNAAKKAFQQLEPPAN